MKKSLLIPLISLIIFGCSSDNPDVEIDPTDRLTILNVTPERVKIGDTIKISGFKLDLINEMVFFNENQTGSNDLPKHRYRNSFITQTEDEITIKMPWFHHEDVTIDFKNLDETSWDLELYGMIPIYHSFESIQQIKVIDANTAFIRDAGKIYKSTDGFHSWVPVFEGNANHFFFLNEMVGWYAIKEGGMANIYYTENGGDSFELQYSLSLPNNSHFIRKMYFVSKDLGYFVTSEPQMYKIQDDSVESIFEIYPELSNQGLSQNVIYNFNVVNESLIFLQPIMPDDPLIKIDNQNISLSYFESGLTNLPQIIGNIGYILSEWDLYKSIDQGTSWTKINSFEDYPQSIRFKDDQFGFVYVKNQPNPPYIKQTFDGGVTWEHYYTFTRFGSLYHLGDSYDFSGTNGLFGKRTSLFKYIE